jgi:hypothetical protein
MKAKLEFDLDLDMDMMTYRRCNAVDKMVEAYDDFLQDCRSVRKHYSDEQIKALAPEVEDLHPESFVAGMEWALQKLASNWPDVE